MNSINNSPGLWGKINQISHRIFWVLIVISFIVLAAIAFYFYQYFKSQEVNFSLKAPQSNFFGVPFNIDINIENISDKPLNDVKISMILPDGAAFVSESLEKRVLNRNLGNLEAYSNFQDKIPLIVFENQESIKKFDITISYFPPTLGPKARFEQTKSVEVSFKEPAIKLDLVAPQKVLNNEEFELEVHYQNTSNFDFSNVELELNYPNFFTLKSASPQPSTGNSFWKIGNLGKNNQGSLIIKGSVLGAEKSFFGIDGLLKIEVAGQKYLLTKKTATINIAPSPLNLEIVLNDQPNYIAFLDNDLRYKINFRNNADIGLNDVVIKAKLIGEMFDFQTLRTNGFFNSKDNTIIWNTANTPGLRLVQPGADGFVEFEIKTKKSYPIKRVSDKNFVLKVEAEISSPAVPYYVAADQTIGLAELKNKVAGDIKINSQASFIKGNWPPKVNKPTTFDIHWTIVNYSTDVSKIEVRAFLQAGIVWTGQVKSNINTVPVYNERTQEIVWSIDRITATKGITSKPVEAIFQVIATPNITQINQRMPILSETNISGIDEFTNIKLKNTASDIESNLAVVE
jgi:hypothetical protein